MTNQAPKELVEWAMGPTADENAHGAMNILRAYALALESKLAAIRKAIVAYKSEQENPSKDYVMIRLRRKELFNTLSEARVKP